MTIGLPSPLIFQSSNVIDDVPHIRDLEFGCTAPIFDKGKEVRGDRWIWEYQGEENYVVPQWNQADADAGKYEIGDIFFKDCKTVKIVGKKGGDIFDKKRPKEPENYSCYDEPINGNIIDPDKFKCRYFRVPSGRNNAHWQKFLSNTYYSPSGDTGYTMYWENRGYCGEDQWRWFAYHIPYGPGSLRPCLGKGYAYKYDAAKDIKAEVRHGWWPATGGNPNDKIVLFKSAIERAGYIYFRTHLDIPVEYGAFAGTKYEYQVEVVNTPADIPGFVKKRQVNALNPFDGKNYTATKTYPPNNVARWVVTPADPIDCIAFGRVLGDSITLTVTDNSGNVVEKITNYPINNRLNKHSEREYPTTVILYSKRNADGTSKLLDPTHTITIEIHGYYVELGECIGGETIDAGLTKVSFNNKLKDFSPREQDRWGNWYYKEGVKVSVITGTVEMPIADYDGMERLMLLIGGKKVIINGSDSIDNAPPDGEHIFSATMKIARFINFNLATSEKNKRIGDIAKYTFTAEEVV